MYEDPNWNCFLRLLILQISTFVKTLLSPADFVLLLHLVLLGHKAKMCVKQTIYNVRCLTNWTGKSVFNPGEYPHSNEMNSRKFSLRKHPGCCVYS